MEILKHKLIKLFSVAIAFGMIAMPGNAANLSDQDKKFLTSYEKVRAALVADDLVAARTAASELGDAGTNIANATSLKDARAGFETLSSRAKTLAAGRPDCHVFHCPMLKKDWVQTSTTVANPYGGKDMVSCGKVKK